MNLAEKLLYIQQNLKAPKNQYNKFGNFKYRSCEDILEAVKPLLAETKTVLLISDDIQVKGDRFYVVSTAVLRDTESSETFENRACAREAEDNKAKMDAAQVTGTSSTYARKYALNGLFCIDDSKDPDMAEPEGKRSRQGAVKTAAKLKQHPSSKTPVWFLRAVKTAAKLKQIQRRKLPAVIRRILPELLTIQKQDQNM